MPIRVEKWIVQGRPRYRVIGVAWGGNGRIRRLEMQLNANQAYSPVELIHMPRLGPLTFWRYLWVPESTGLYRIRLRLADSNVRARRLDTGYYTRSVNIENF